MKKAQASSELSNLKQGLITFPGYAGILVAWSAVLGFLAWWLTNIFLVDTPTKQVVVVTDSAAPSNGLGAAAVVLSIVIILVMFAAIWVYVAEWTKNALTALARLFRVGSDAYWGFCTTILMIGWITAAALLYAVSGDKYAGEFLFVAAGAISIGSVSFGVASMKNITTIPTEQEFSFKFAKNGSDRKLAKIALTKKVPRSQKKKTSKT